jgi:hypothetical protein
MIRLRQFNKALTQFKAKLNELEPEEVEDHIETPDIVLSVQLSQPLSTKIRVSILGLIDFLYT